MSSTHTTPPSSPTRLEQLLILLALVLATVLASAYGLCTQDDAFISFRYAQNLWEGHGLVFNSGEKVEGITNLLWTLFFVPAFALNIDPVLFSIILGLLSLGSLIMASIQLGRIFSISSLPIALLIAIDGSVLLESMEGLESIFYASLCTWGMVFGLRAQDKFSPASVGCFALAMLTRPDAPYIFLLYQMVWFWKYRNVRTLVSAFGTFVAVGVLLTLWRLYYYGEYLPNTFYAKVGGWAWTRGLLYLKFYFQYHVLLLIALCYGLRRTPYRFLIIIYMGYTLYVCAIGGDFKPTSRFMLPLSAIAVISAAALLQRASVFWRVVLVAVWLYPQFHLYQRTLSWAEDRRMNLISRRVAGLWIKSTTPSYAKIAIHSVGVIPFYAQRHTIDMWGLNDKVIARTPVRNFGDGLAGHERSNPEYVFSQLPDMYLPEDKMFLPQKVTHTPPEDFPPQFKENYRSVSIQIGASFLNIWVRKDLLRNKEETEVKP